MTHPLRFSVLGPLRAWRAGHELQLGPRKQQAVLAVLLMRSNAYVPVDYLVDAIWGANPPASAVNSVRIYIHRLRRLLDAGARAPIVRSACGGYVLSADQHMLDLIEFEQRLATADRARRAGDLLGFASHLRQGLTLWHGKALENLHSGWADQQRTRLERRRLSAIDAQAVASLDLGWYGAVLDELTEILCEYPLDERFRELLMVALYRSGRPAAALTVYQDAQRLLAEQLGVDPGPTLQKLYRRILRGDEQLLVSAHPAG